MSNQKITNEYYRVFTHNLPIGMGIHIVKNGKFVFVNHGLSESFGYSEEELIGRNALSLVHPEDVEKTRFNAVEMLKGKRLTPYEFRVMTKAGEIRWLMVTVAPFHLGDKREVLGNCMDITDVKRAEEVLRESEERYRTIIENIEDGYYELDSEGRFKFFNEPCR
jgi:PAS domain S-box-containing protein